MPATPVEHVKKADANKDFGYGMNAAHPTSAGWALTAMFYSALHYARAYLLKTHVQTDSHGDLFDAIKFDPKLKGIYAQYRHLFDYGINARYRLNVYGRADVEKAKPSLEFIEHHIKKLL
jgi:hypothetical protein